MRALKSFSESVLDFNRQATAAGIVFIACKPYLILLALYEMRIWIGADLCVRALLLVVDDCEKDEMFVII
jgi:hypothetical protein